MIYKVYVLVQKSLNYFNIYGIFNQNNVFEVRNNLINQDPFNQYIIYGPYDFTDINILGFNLDQNKNLNHTNIYYPNNLSDTINNQLNETRINIPSTNEINLIDL